MGSLICFSLLYLCLCVHLSRRHPGATLCLRRLGFLKQEGRKKISVQLFVYQIRFSKSLKPPLAYQELGLLGLSVGFNVTRVTTLISLPGTCRVCVHCPGLMIHSHMHSGLDDKLSGRSIPATEEVEGGEPSPSGLVECGKEEGRWGEGGQCVFVCYPFSESGFQCLCVSGAGGHLSSKQRGFLRHNPRSPGKAAIQGCPLQGRLAVS